MQRLHRRQFLRDLGISAAALPFLTGLPDLMGATLPQRRQRLVIMFSPNGTLPDEFWPDQQGGDFAFKSILNPLEPFKDRTLILHGIANKVRHFLEQHTPKATGKTAKGWTVTESTSGDFKLAGGAGMGSTNSRGAKSASA